MLCPHHFTLERHLVPTVQKAGRTGTKNLPPPPVGFNPWTIQPITSCNIPNTKITYFFVYKVTADPGGCATIWQWSAGT